MDGFIIRLPSALHFTYCSGHFSFLNGRSGGHWQMILKSMALG